MNLFKYECTWQISHINTSGNFVMRTRKRGVHASHWRLESSLVQAMDTLVRDWRIMAADKILWLRFSWEISSYTWCEETFLKKEGNFGQNKETFFECVLVGTSITERTANSKQASRFLCWSDNLDSCFLHFKTKVGGKNSCCCFSKWMKLANLYECFPLTRLLLTESPAQFMQSGYSEIRLIDRSHLPTDVGRGFFSWWKLLGFLFSFCCYFARKMVLLRTCKKNDITILCCCTEENVGSWGTHICVLPAGGNVFIRNLESVCPIKGYWQLFLMLQKFFVQVCQKLFQCSSILWAKSAYGATTCADEKCCMQKVQRWQRKRCRRRFAKRLRDTPM